MEQNHYAPVGACSHQALMDAIQEPPGQPSGFRSALLQKNKSQERVYTLEGQLAAARSELEKDWSELVTSADGQHSQPQKIARLQKQQCAGWNYNLGTEMLQLIATYLDPQKPMAQNLTSKRLTCLFGRQEHIADGDARASVYRQNANQNVKTSHCYYRRRLEQFHCQWHCIPGEAAEGAQWVQHHDLIAERHWNDSFHTEANKFSRLFWREWRLNTDFCDSIRIDHRLKQIQIS